MKTKMEKKVLPVLLSLLLMFGHHACDSICGRL